MGRAVIGCENFGTKGSCSSGGGFQGREGWEIVMPEIKDVQKKKKEDVQTNGLKRKREGLGPFGARY